MRVTFLTARDKIAIGIIHQLDARDHMVETARMHRNVAEAIKTTPAFPRVYRSAPGRMIQEVQFLQKSFNLSTAWQFRLNDWQTSPIN